MPHDSRGQSRVHTVAVYLTRVCLRSYLLWCEDQRLGPLTASRAQLELYLRWMQEVPQGQHVVGHGRTWRGAAVIQMIIPRRPAAATV